MNDAEFLKQFEAGHLHEFPHRAHLRMAWLYLRADGFEQGSDKIRVGVHHLAAAHGTSGKYHETITMFWIYLVHYAMTLNPEIERFERFIDAHNHLLDSGLLKRHYSARLLKESRAVWSAPDLAPLPGAELQHDSA